MTDSTVTTELGVASVTTWTRLEPRIAAPDLRDGVAARVEDAAWLLCRQWQLGEFDGSDGGSPVSARLRLRAGVLSGYRGLGEAAGTAQTYDGTRLPLETLVEREAPSDTDVSLRADGGRQFLRQLRAGGLGSYVAAFTAAYPLPVVAPGPAADPATVDRLRVLADRVPDAAALATAFTPGGKVGLPVLPAVALKDRPAMLAVITEFLRRWHGLVSRPGTADSAWRPHRLEHAFALGARVGDQDVTLVAPEYPGGSLDWYDLDVAGDGVAPVPATQPPVELVRTGLPTPVRYPGMPADRWWEFEDCSVSFVGAEAGAPDLGRLLMLEFAVLYSNDWFVVPVELPVGCLASVGSLVVTDTFGVRTLVGPAAGGDWEMFRLGGAGQELFLLPPALPDGLQGAPVEDVLLLRDENANVVWAVERFVEGAAGTPVDRHERHLAAVRAADPDTAAWVRATGLPAAAAQPAADLYYRLRDAQPPQHWVPLLPEAAPEGLRLRRSALHRPGGPPIPPAGQVLRGTDWVAAEEVARDGIQVSRAWQLARWSDGSTHLWCSHRKITGPGEAHSGLRHDVLERIPPADSQ